MKTTKEFAGYYTHTAADGTRYVIQHCTPENSKAFWTWYRDNGMTSMGEDAYVTKREAVAALEAWLKPQAEAKADPEAQPAATVKDDEYYNTYYRWEHKITGEISYSNGSIYSMGPFNPNYYIKEISRAEYEAG